MGAYKVKNSRIKGISADDILLETEEDVEVNHEPFFGSWTDNDKKFEVDKNIDLLVGKLEKVYAHKIIDRTPGGNEPRHCIFLVDDCFMYAFEEEFGDKFQVIPNSGEIVDSEDLILVYYNEEEGLYFNYVE